MICLWIASPSAVDSPYSNRHGRAVSAAERMARPTWTARFADHRERLGLVEVGDRHRLGAGVGVGTGEDHVFGRDDVVGGRGHARFERRKSSHGRAG